MMKYILIGSELHTLPTATEVTANNIEEAKLFLNKFIREAHGDWQTVTDEEGNQSYQKKGNRNNYQAFFLVDVEKGEIRRTFFNSKGEAQLTDVSSAFMPLGIATEDSFFEEEGD